jgi:hypothetical protein
MRAERAIRGWTRANGPVNQSERCGNRDGFERGGGAWECRCPQRHATEGGGYALAGVSCAGLVWWMGTELRWGHHLRGRAYQRTPGAVGDTSARRARVRQGYDCDDCASLGAATLPGTPAFMGAVPWVVALMTWKCVKMWTAVNAMAAPGRCGRVLVAAAAEEAGLVGPVQQHDQRAGGGG